MKVISTTLLLFFSTLFFGQTADNTGRHNEENIYYQALTQYLSYIKSDRNITPDTIYIENDFKLTDSLLLQSGQTKFVKLTFDNVAQLLKKRKGLTVFRLFPLRYEKGEFSVSFVPFIVTKGKTKNNITYANPGGYFVIFKFEKNQFHFVRIEDHGI